MDKKLVGVIEKAGDGGYGIYALEDVIPVTSVTCLFYNTD